VPVRMGMPRAMAKSTTAAIWAPLVMRAPAESAPRTTRGLETETSASEELRRVQVCP
jgi:hypothetical protein